VADKRVKRGTAVATAVATGVGGAVAAEQDWLHELISAFTDLLDKHGLAVALSALLVVAALGLVWILLRETLKSKDAEDSASSREKNRLYDHVLHKRPSSGRKKP
jgi:hypothetical protein